MPETARERGAALLQQGSFLEAAAALREAVAQDGGDEAAWRYLGAALGSSGDAPGAVAAFERTVALSPTSAKNRFNLALAQERAGDLAGARASLEQSLALDPGYTQASEQLARLGGVAAPTTPSPPSAPPAAAPWDSSSELPAGQDAPPPLPATAMPEGGRTFLSIVLAFFAALIGTVLWIAFVLLTKFNLALIAIGVGWLTGFAAAKGYGHGAKTPGIIAAVCAFLFIGGFTGFDLVGSILSEKGFQMGWSVLFNVLCLFWGVQQAHKTGSSSE